LNKIKHYPPKYCPECGGTNINSVPCWTHSQWLAKPNDPEWKPFYGITYDTWCYDCGAGFDIIPGKEADVYWYDEHPDQIPEGGNKIYTDVLLRRSYTEEAERCGNCVHFFSGFIDCKWEGIYCKLDKSKEVSYYSLCAFNPSKFTMEMEK